MEVRPLEIKLISADDLVNVNRFTSMGVYSFVLINGDPRRRQKSPTDRYAGTSPKWNYLMHFTVDEADLQKGNLTLVFQLRSERYLGDRDIGEVHIPLKDLLPDGDKSYKEHRTLKYDLSTKAGKQKGTLDFSYLFGDIFTVTAPFVHPSADGDDNDNNNGGSKFGVGLGATLLGMGGLFVAADVAEDGGAAASAAPATTN